MRGAVGGVPAAAEAKRDGVYLAVVLANTWQCHFEGETPIENLLCWVERVAGLGVPELGLADTTGAARPQQVYERVRAVRDAFSQFFLRVHLHEGGSGLENARAACEAGADGLDAALQGLGGSPFAGKFVGNLDLRQLHEAGLVELDLDGIRRAEMLLRRHIHNQEAYSS